MNDAEPQTKRQARQFSEEFKREAVRLIVEEQYTFKAAAATEEFKALGPDAAELGVPHSVYVADVNA